MENDLTNESVASTTTDPFDVAVERINRKAIIPSELPNWAKADPALQNKLQFIIRRLNFSISLLDDDISKWISAVNEDYELPALRTYLLLACVNMLGEISRVEPPLTFLSWLDTSNSAATKTVREDSISKAINSLGTVDDQMKAVKLIKSVFAQYRLNNSVESNFVSFFADTIDADTKNWIATNCWIYQDNPLEKWANLQSVKEGYLNSTTPENKRLTNSRKRWDSLELNQKLFEVSLFLEFLLNQFSLCHVNAPPKLDKDPIARVWKSIDLAVNDYKVNYLSNSLFNQLGTDGQKFKFNEVRCVFKEDELIVFEGDLREKDRDLWLKRLSEWLKTKLDIESITGDTIFLTAKNQALVIDGDNLTTLLETWIEKALIKMLKKK